MSDAAGAARYNVRPLSPGPESVLRDSVLRLGLPTDRLSQLARHGSVEVLAVQGLSPDQARILERTLAERGGAVLTDADGRHALLLAPLMAMGELPAVLTSLSQSAQALGEAIGAALMARGTPPPPVRAGDHVLDFSARTLVMGVLNVTPDSFAGDSVGGDLTAAVARAHEMIAAGADIIDVGGESTRPNSQPVSADEELARVLPVLEALCPSLPVPVSIDTRKSEVARRAVAAGAVIVNDVWGLRGDPAMAGVVAENPHVAVVVMHNQRGTEYGDLMADVCSSLRESLLIAEGAGVPATRVVIDPGFGFAKTPSQNLELMRRLGELRGIGRPIMLGPSRKHTIGAILDGVPPAERIEGTLAMITLGIASGVSMVRVHDVAQAARAARVADAVVRGTPAHITTLPAPGPTG